MFPKGGGGSINRTVRKEPSRYIWGLVSTPVGVAAGVTHSGAKAGEGIEDIFMKGLGQAKYADPSITKHPHTLNHLLCCLEIESSRPFPWGL